MNAGIREVDSAILFGESDEIAVKTLIGNGKGTRIEQRFDSVYQHVHFVPMNEFGIRLLRILVFSAPNALLSAAFPPELLSMGQGSFEYDAYIDGVYILSHLDGDIARLIRFKEAIKGQKGRFEVLCFEEQKCFLHTYLGELAFLKTITIDAAEAVLGLARKEVK